MSKNIPNESELQNEEDCTCDRCQYHREVQAHLSKLQPEQKAFFMSMYEDYVEMVQTFDDLEEETNEEYLEKMPITENIVYH